MYHTESIDHDLDSSLMRMLLLLLLRARHRKHEAWPMLAEPQLHYFDLSYRLVEQQVVYDCITSLKGINKFGQLNGMCLFIGNRMSLDRIQDRIPPLDKISPDIILPDKITRTESPR